MSFLNTVLGGVGGALLNGVVPGASVFTGALLGNMLDSSNAAQSAAGAQVDASNRATQLQKDIFDQIYKSGQPYRDAGGVALGRLQDLLGISGNKTADGYGSLMGTFTPADFLANKDPGYEWQLQQGQQALQNSQAAGNGVLSGAALKDLMGYNQGMASTAYQSAFDRFMTQQNNQYGRLGNLVSLGENSAVNQGNTGANFANGMSNSIIGAGNAAAAGQIGSANAFSSGISNLLGYSQLGKLLGDGGSNGIYMGQMVGP